MKKILLLVIFGLGIVSCDPPTNNPDNDPVDDPDAVLAEGNIGSSGGVVEAEGIIISVPPESFSSTVTIQIFSGEESDNVFGDNAVTPPYRIEGLPEEFSKPIEVAIKFSGSLANENYLALGHEIEVIESEDPAFSTSLFEAVDSAGYLISAIEPPGISSAPEGSKKKSSSGGTPTEFLMGLSNMTSEETPFFKLSHQFHADKVKIRKLAAYMDAAIDTFASMGLISKSYAEDAIKAFGKLKVDIWGVNEVKYRDWCIEMPELEIQTEGTPPSYGAYIWQNLLDIKISISENVLRLSDEKQIAALAFAWVYRMCCFSQVGSRQDWFTYGSTLWIQEKYSGVAEYNVTTAPEFPMSPLAGMESGKSRFNDVRRKKTVYGGILSVEEGNYGFSMVPLIKYLDRTYAHDKHQIVKILSETILSRTKTATEGIINAIEDPEYIWLPGFYKAYLTRKLYDISFDHFKDKIRPQDQLDFNKVVDTLMTNEEDYADLSAKLFKVNFLMPEFKEVASLNFKLGPPARNLDYLTTMVFGLKDGELDYLDQSADLTLPNVAELKNNGYHSIVALVVNSANEPPFNEGLRIELDTEMRVAPKDFDWVIIKVMALSNFTYSYGDEGVSEVVYTAGKLRKGKMTGNLFTASWSEPLSDGTSSGNIDISFDPDRFPNYITGFWVTETQKLSSTRTYTINGENLEFWGYKEPSGTYVYRVKDEEVKDYISYINEKYTASDGYGYSTDGIPLTQSNSYVEIKMGTN